MVKPVTDDLNRAVMAAFIDWEKLDNSVLFITGATGLVGYALVSVLCEASICRRMHTKLVLLVRDEEAAKQRFHGMKEYESISFVQGSVENFHYEGKVDHIIHCASQTASSQFVEKPVETIDTAVLGSRELLKLAVKNKVRSFVYLSSMEVYGEGNKERKVKETDIGVFDTLSTRNCYPLSKLLCENLCFSFYSEYGVPVRIARLSQVIGGDMHVNDKRVISYFKKCVEKGEDIRLTTSGGSRHCFIHALDCALALLSIMLNGNDGEIYNVATEGTCCSIAELAEKISKRYGIGVCFENTSDAKYPNEHVIDVDTSKLKNLNWKPIKSDIMEIFDSIID